MEQAEGHSLPHTAALGCSTAPGLAPQKQFCSHTRNLFDVSCLPNRYSHHTLSKLTRSKCQLATDLPQITDTFLSNLLPPKSQFSSALFMWLTCHHCLKPSLASAIEETTLLTPRVCVFLDSTHDSLT